MSEAPHSRSILKSIGAVFAGVLLIIILSLGTDIVMHATGIYPPWFQPMSTPLWLFATAYRIIYGIAGGYLTARLAPDRPMTHALALGVVGLLLSIAGAAGTWNAGPEYGPKWYPIGLVLISLPCAWLGGKLFVARSGSA
jgi:peptidoglycan/LPS O-acetylase OafA/YrhL